MNTAPSDIKQRKLQLETGFTMHYAETGGPAGHPVIFLHGITDSWVSFSGVLPLLPEHFHAFALDQRGHGDSERPERYDLDAFAADVKAFMAAKSIGEATLVGHSMGSYVAQRVALNHPELVSSLVLVGSMTTPVNDVTKELDTMFRTVTDPVNPDFVTEFQTSTIHHPVPDAFLERIIQESLKLPARVWRDAWAGFFAGDHAPRLSEVRAPTLILWGEEDGAFPLEDQTRLVDLVPDATLKRYPDTGHALHWERAEQFVEDLVTFLQDKKPLEPVSNAL